jgi:4-hydroxybenzoate polyprenyltransferase
VAPRRIGPASSGALLARIRLVHPFPSLLDGAVVAAVALVGGGGPTLALILGASMTLLQFAIGALNDAVDSPRDAGRRDSKPIPAGLVSIRTALVVAGLCAAGGLLLAFAGGPGLVLLALAVLAIGAWYDLAAKGTTLSWLPLAVGVPLLPVYGWFGATGGLPGVFLVLVPAAANAGAALAIANSTVDIERDRAAGTGSIAITLGARRASLVVLVLHLVVAALAVATAAVIGAPRGWMAVLLATTLVPLGGAMYGVVAARRPGTGARELAWEIQAVGTGLVAVAWVSALSASAAGLADG